MRRIRRHLSFANVASAIALFVALGGGTAVALNGSNTVQSDDLGPGAQVKAPDVAANAVGSSDVVNESLTGQDIKDQSGIQTCNRPLVRRFGRICEGSDGGVRTWRDASAYCTKYGLRLPTLGEALAMASKYVVDGVNNGDYFWTDNVYISGGLLRALTVGDFATNGTFIGDASFTDTRKTVCVANPTS
jgi:hypothetical protein